MQNYFKRMLTLMTNWSFVDLNEIKGQEPLEHVKATSSELLFDPRITELSQHPKETRDIPSQNCHQSLLVG